MNNKLLTKVIKFYDKSCPEFVYENPLLNKSVARSVAKSFVSILEVSHQNSNMSSNLRLCVLENIRELCQTDAAGHKVVDDNFLPMLTQFYNMNIEDLENAVSDSSDYRLNTFLIRNMSVNSSFNSELNPEVIQALLNLNSQGIYLDKLSTDIIHWDNKSDKHQILIKELWTNEDTLDILTGSKIIDNVSKKNKAELERIILEFTYQNLQNKRMNIPNFFSSNHEFENLVKKCSVSGACFQMSIEILNFIFTTTNFDSRLQEFITYFVNQVKELLPAHKFMALYPGHLCSLVILLDINLEVLESSFKDRYIGKSLDYLNRLHKESEHDFILILSHYPQWFDAYFNHFNKEQILAL